MIRGEGESWDALSAVALALSTRDGQLAEADRLLVATVRSAHQLALASIDRIEEVRAAIDAAAQHPADGPAAANELARLMAAQHRRVIDVINQARAESAAKAAELQRLTDSYQFTA